jgi:hypothetical protein
MIVLLDIFLGTGFVSVFSALIAIIVISKS